VCNGADDDCDGLEDEELFGVVGGETRVTDQPGASVYPAQSWDGSQFQLVWADDRSPNGIYFNAVDDLGVRYADTFVAGTGHALPMPALAPGPSGSGVAWVRGGQLKFARVSSTGAVLSAPVVLSSTAGVYRPELAYAGSGESGVAWTDAREGDFEIYFTIVDPDGAPLISDVRVTDATGNSVHPSLIHTGTGYALSWMDARDGRFEIYFARLDNDGVALGPDVRVTDSLSLSASPSLAWNGAEFGLAWVDFRSPPGIYFAQLDATGTPVGPAQHLAVAFPACWGARSLVWAGSYYGLVWEDLRDGDYDVFFTRLTAAGDRLDSDIWVTTAPLDSRCPVLAWNGAAFGVAWSDERQGVAGGAEIYHTRIGCP
jgi:hypothetical protein